MHLEKGSNWWSERPISCDPLRRMPVILQDLDSLSMLPPKWNPDDLVRTCQSKNLPTYFWLVSLILRFIHRNLLFPHWQSCLLWFAWRCFLLRFQRRYWCFLSLSFAFLSVLRSSWLEHHSFPRTGHSLSISRCRLKCLIYPLHDLDLAAVDGFNFFGPKAIISGFWARDSLDGHAVWYDVLIVRPMQQFLGMLGRRHKLRVGRRGAMVRHGLSKYLFLAN